MNISSPWLLNTNTALNKNNPHAVYEKESGGYHFSIVNIEDALWLIAAWPKGSRIAFRLAYSPNDHLEIKKITEEPNRIIINIGSLMGKQQISIQLPHQKQPVLHYTTTLIPAAPLLFPYWPRDIVPLGADNSDILANGEVKVSQVGTRSGQLYFQLTRPKAGSVFYLQNLTALADYNQDTETSAGNTVGGEWPEIGFALPPTIKHKPLIPGKHYIISDAFIAFSNEVPADEPAMIKQYLDLLAAIYLQLPKPATTYKDWPGILQNGLRDLQDNPGCWSQVDGNHYLNAYVCDYATPPEIMVQLAVLLPLLDYVEWNDSQLTIMKKIKDGLPSFYEEKYGTIMRWHPKVADKMQGEEEHKKPLIMDSWYLQHPLLNLSRLALKDDKTAKKLFLDSLEFAIRVAHHFDYSWPVFYKIDTLEVIKAETQPGKGGEKDVPGLYAHVMLQAWELTGEKRYLAEAEKSALHLKGLGFDLFYQANNTAFAAGAMLRLYKITGKNVYLELSYLCLANVFKNVQLWDCNYGYGKNLPTFFALFPLSDAPYTAVYEEQEVFCALHDYLLHSKDIAIEPSVRLLTAEYIRFLVERAVYYYPTMLPKEMLSEEVKTGEVDPNLWIALEDLHDGWEKSGEVGQEVYGAGNAFGILPRHYMQVEEAGLMIYTDYPIYGFSKRKHSPARFRLAGDGRLNCRLMIVKTSHAKLPQLTVTLNNREEIKGKNVAGGNMEFEIPGDGEIKIDWNIS
jgi:hypothetical protein